MRVFLHTHLFCLLGTIPQTPLNTEFILWLRVLQTLLKGTLKRRLLCRDVTNRYTFMRWQYTIPSGDISFPKRGVPKWKPLTRDDSYGILSLQKGVPVSDWYVAKRDAPYMDGDVKRLPIKDVRNPPIE